MSTDLRFHHVGVACRSLERERATFAILGYAPEGDAFEDPIQRVRGQFLVGAGPRLELLEPLGDGSPVVPWLEKGVKYYHQAFETDALRDALDGLRADGAKLVAGPVPAVAFANREIAFLMLPGLVLVELIQADLGAGVSGAKGGLVDE